MPNVANGLGTVGYRHRKKANEIVTPMPKRKLESIRLDIKGLNVCKWSGSV